MGLASFSSLEILPGILAVLFDDEEHAVGQALLPLADLHGMQRVFVGNRAGGRHRDAGVAFSVETPSGSSCGHGVVLISSNPNTASI